MKKKLELQTVDRFGFEWRRFDQSRLSDAEARKIFGEYFAVFRWQALPQVATGADMGFGSDRWASAQGWM